MCMCVYVHVCYLNVCRCAHMYMCTCVGVMCVFYVVLASVGGCVHVL